MLQQLLSSNSLPTFISHLHKIPPPGFQEPLRIIWLSYFHKFCPITQHLLRSFLADLEPLLMTLPTARSLAPPLSAPFLNQLVVREGLGALGVRDMVHAEQQVRRVSALGPRVETARDGACGPADFDVARRRSPVEYVKRASLKVSVYQVIEDSP